MKSQSLQIAHYIAERYPQIVNFWTAYPKKDIVKALEILNVGLEKGLEKEGWQEVEGKPDDKEFFEYKGKFYIQKEGFEGMVTDTPLAQNYNELDEDAKKFLLEEAEAMRKILPYCGCGKQLNLVGVCGSCLKGVEGFKSKFICSCGYEEFFKESYQDKLKELQSVINERR